MAHMTATAVERAAREMAAHRHELDVERRRAHPGEPRRTVVTDRPPAREDRRGAHGYARGGR
ncbi:hypothetical protein [Ideonella sp. BN130291]|uniref:hypothetical protein n=1 Tax=Ideonella sp. BN130291 TaxID=3112940 RepID=UPI002E25F0BE|nr:hypothetical protein [Ideonella sp. BN130291]